ncbi:MAG: hypothetical protein LUC92_04935 [Clostridiales bacterium]|nr:hypothetical protein [Clostridiales bacterium]
MKNSATYDDIIGTSSDSGDDNSGSETDSTITSEQTLDVSNLGSTSYFQINDTSSGVYVNGSVMRITSTGKISFTTGIDGAVVTVVGAHASSNSEADDRTLTLYDSTDTAVTGGEITYAQSNKTTDPVEIPSSSTLSAGSYYLAASDHLNITSITVSFPGVITDTATLTFTNSGTADEELNADSTAYSDYFTLLATESKTLKVSTKSSKTFADYVTYDYCLKSGGTSAYTNNIPTARAIKFATSGAGVVQLYGVASGDDSDRYARVYDSNGTAGELLGTMTVNGKNNTKVSEIIKLPSAGTYYIVFENAVSLYAVNVMVGASVETDSSGSGYIFTDSSDSYVVAGTAISSSEFENYSDMTVTVTADGEASVSTDTVYAAAVVDGFIIQPSALGDEYTYIYIVQVESSGGAADFAYEAYLNEIETDSENA